MSAKIQVSRDEKNLLSLLVIGILGLLILLILLNTIFNNLGSPLFSQDQAEIALMVQDQDKTPGKEIFEIAQLTAKKASLDSNASSNVPKISIHVYETGGSPDSAAWAALMASRNSNTIAVIGPFDARQSIAVAETLYGKKLAVLTTDGLAPSISAKNTALSNVFHLSLPDTEQARQTVAFLSRKGWNDVFVIAEETAYAAKMLDTFNKAANRVINVVGSANISSQSPQDIAASVSDLNPKAVFYIGKPEKVTDLLKEINQRGLLIPFIGLEPLNEPSFISAYSGLAPVYYASSFLNLKVVEENKISDPYRSTLVGKMASPYAYETSEAVWFIYNALKNNRSGGTIRERILNGMSQSTAIKWDGGTARFTDRWRSPGQVFFYKINQSGTSLYLVMEQ